MPFDLKGKRVFVAGHRGMVGSALVRRLGSEDVEILTAPRSEVDLLDPSATSRWFAATRPQVVFHAAAKVGGIEANNTLRGEFIYENLLIATNVIHAAHVHGVEKLLFLGSSCIYPKLAPQPLREDSLLTDTLEPTNEPLCDRQDRRREDGGGLSQPVRQRLHQHHADQPLWSRRQLSSGIQPRRRSAHSPLPRSQGKRRARGSGVGHRDATA